MTSKAASTVSASFSILLVLTSLAALALVVERLWAALWQLYKFAGTTTPGHITLSPTTSAMFLALVALLMLASLGATRVAGHLNHPQGVRISRWAACIAAVSALLYVALYVGPLNIPRV